MIQFFDSIRVGLLNAASWTSTFAVLQLTADFFASGCFAWVDYS
jgi:hypothetical protein